LPAPESCDRRESLPGRTLRLPFGGTAAAVAGRILCKNDPPKINRWDNGRPLSNGSFDTDGQSGRPFRADGKSGRMGFPRGHLKQCRHGRQGDRKQRGSAATALPRPPRPFHFEGHCSGGRPPCSLEVRLRACLRRP
jgi:hypothetical protein